MSSLNFYLNIDVNIVAHGYRDGKSNESLSHTSMSCRSIDRCDLMHTTENPFSFVLSVICIDRTTKVTSVSQWITMTVTFFIPNEFPCTNFFIRYWCNNLSTFLFTLAEVFDDDQIIWTVNLARWKTMRDVHRHVFQASLSATIHVPSCMLEIYSFSYFTVEDVVSFWQRHSAFKCIDVVLEFAFTFISTTKTRFPMHIDIVFMVFLIHFCFKRLNLGFCSCSSVQHALPHCQMCDFNKYRMHVFFSCLLQDQYSYPARDFSSRQLL